MSRSGENDPESDRPVMDDGDLVEGDPRDEIVRLEARIEELGGVIESCRKIIVISRAAIAVGVSLLLALAMGAINLDPTMMVAAIAAVIGGIVLVINLWPLREERRHRRNLEQLMERHRAWQQSRRDTQP